MARDPTAWTREEKAAFAHQAGQVRDAATRIRYLIVLHTAEGHGRRRIAEMLGCSTATVDKFRKRFRLHGVAGLIDRRGDNGSPKVTDAYAERLLTVVAGSPPDHGHRRPTWTQELLVMVMKRRTGIGVSGATMSRLLQRLGVRRGMPKPTVGCPWSQRSRTRRIRWISRLIETLPANETAFWEDEVDIHLNPKIGPDYMLRGQQKTVKTPGKNVKRYVAGAMEARTHRLIWTEATRKNSDLFVDLLRRLCRAYPDHRVLHVILDNFVIHHRRRTQAAVQAFGGRIVLHFLPPYCPDDNKIERCVWRERHAHVTRNHTCETMDELMVEVRYDLAARNRQTAARNRRAA